MIEYVTGDLLASDEPIIAHGCNTMAVMGSGIARLIHLKLGSLWPVLLSVSTLALASCTTWRLSVTWAAALVHGG